MTNKIAEAIKEADELTKTSGVQVKGGKNYLQVKDRVSIFRKKFGLDYGINTNIVVDDGQRIVIKAIVTDRDGRLIGSGYAEEIRGRGVNLTSAIENCETSSIGRALSSLSLHGGEYASANEMEAVGRKEEAIKQQTDDKSVQSVQSAQIDELMQPPAPPPIDTSMPIIPYIEKCTREVRQMNTLAQMEAYKQEHMETWQAYRAMNENNRQIIGNFFNTWQQQKQANEEK